MKKLTALILLVLLVPFFSGCMMLNAWVIKGDGKKLLGGYKLVEGKADRLDIIGLRYLVLTDQRITRTLLENLPVIRITVDNDNKTKLVEIGPEQNFGPKE